MIIASIPTETIKNGRISNLQFEDIIPAHQENTVRKNEYYICEERIYSLPNILTSFPVLQAIHYMTNRQMEALSQGCTANDDGDNHNYAFFKTHGMCRSVILELIRTDAKRMHRSKLR